MQDIHHHHHHHHHHHPRHIDPRLKGALSHPKRIELLGHVVRRGDGITEGELADGLGLTLAQVAYHLVVLDRAELICRVDDLVHWRSPTGVLADRTGRKA